MARKSGCAARAGGAVVARAVSPLVMWRNSGAIMRIMFVGN
jgi:hypothetical protein